jgi:protein-S-isoprenylcysteine O-methyltransferase Ste14
MGRILSLCYGIVAYLIFVGAFLYAIGFVDGVVVPKTVDDGTTVAIAEAIAINLVLLTIFALQHSIMARQPFKRWWTTVIPASIERSTYVLLASLALILVFWQWRPIPTVIWQVESPAAASALLGL